MTTWQDKQFDTIFRDIGAYFNFWPMWNSQGQWRPSWKCHNVWHIRKMLLMLLLKSVQSLRVLTFCTQWMCLAALLRWHSIAHNLYTETYFYPHHHSTNSYEPMRFLQTSQNRLINIHRNSLKHISQSALFGFSKNIGHDQIWYENSVVFKAVQWLFMIKERSC